MLKAQLEQDLKAALLSGDKHKATTLRGLKSAILYEEVAQNLRETGLSDEQIVKVFSKQLKQRHEAAALYDQGDNTERAELERQEAKIIEKYLPAQLDEAAVKKIVETQVSKVENPSLKEMGAIISAVRAETQGQADGALIARLVKEAIGA